MKRHTKVLYLVACQVPCCPFPGSLHKASNAAKPRCTPPQSVVPGVQQPPSAMPSAGAHPFRPEGLTAGLFKIITSSALCNTETTGIDSMKCTVTYTQAGRSMSHMRCAPIHVSVWQCHAEQKLDATSQSAVQTQNNLLFRRVLICICR